MRGAVGHLFSIVVQVQDTGYRNKFRHFRVGYPYFSKLHMFAALLSGPNPAEIIGERTAGAKAVGFEAGRNNDVRL